MKRKLYQILKASKIDPVSAPDMFTALMAKKLAGGGATEKEYTGAVPYTFTANGEPLLDWYIKGNTVQSGTPTPQNPVMPEGTGERTGNLFDKTDILSGYEIVNNQIMPNSAWGVSGYIPVEQGKYYTAVNTGSPALEYEVIGGTAVRSGKSITTGGYTPSETARFIRINFQLPRIGTVMLNTGSTALPYEPYGIKILVSSAGQITPVYLGNVQTTRKIKKLVLTGEETSWHISGDFFFNDDINPDYLRTPYRTVYCTHYQGINNVTAGSKVGDGECAFYSVVGVQRLYIKDSSYTTVAGFKTYLQQQYAAGTPVTVWYVLATPETAVVNEPLRKIGDYADSISDAAQIPTTAGSQTFDVDTTLKPSEVYIKYKG